MESPRPKYNRDGTLFDRAAPTYGQVGPDLFTVLGNLLVQRAAVPVGSKVVDVGAGTGAVSLAACEQVGSSGSVLAIDIAPKMLTQLRDRLSGRMPRPFVTVVMDAGSLGVRTGSFDAALSGIALQSMSDPQMAVAEMCRVVRSGGTFGISVSKGWWWQEDPRWQWHATLLEELGVVIQDAPPSSGQHFLNQLLSDVPLSRVERTKEELEFEFEHAETLWKWCWSHGWRGIMEKLTTEQLDGYRRGIRESIGDDPMPGQLVAHLAIAERR